MTIFVLGGDKVGKTVVAQMLGQRLGFTVAETGDVLIEELARVRSGRDGAVFDDDDVKEWQEKIMKQKDEFRPQLTALGDVLTSLDPGCLVDKCPEEAKIIVGLRRSHEVLPFDYSMDRNIWVRVCGPQRGSSTQGVFELRRHRFDYDLNNFGDFAQLKKNVRELADEIVLRKEDTALKQCA